MVESLSLSRWPFDRIETAPRRANEAGSYSSAGLANALSLAEVATVVRDWTTAGWLLPVTIETGGEPSISTYRSHRVAVASQIQSTITGSVRDRLIASGITGNDGCGFQVTHSALMYRHLTGQFVRDRVEVLHCAEAYQLTGATPTSVQYCPAQGIKEVNNSQQFCAQFSLMWHKVDGSLIPLNQKDQYLPAVAGQPRQLNPHWYTGPTQCPHRAVGCPCYGPYPHTIKIPSFLTPKREGHAAKRAGPKKDEEAKEGKKDSTQRELSFGAGTLQLTK